MDEPTIGIGFFEAAAQIIPVLLLALGASIALARKPVEEIEEMLGEVDRIVSGIDKSEKHFASLVEEFESEFGAGAESEEMREQYTSQLQGQRAEMDTLKQRLKRQEKPARRRVRMTASLNVLIFISLTVGLGAALLVLAQPHRPHFVPAVVVVFAISVGTSGVMLEFVNRLSLDPHGWVDHLINGLGYFLLLLPGLVFSLGLLVVTISSR